MYLGETLVIRTCNRYDLTVHSLPEPSAPMACGKHPPPMFRRKAVPPMTPLSLRPEIKAFCDATETLLSPVLLRSPLNQEELGMIRLYMQSLEEKVLGTATTPATLEDSSSTRA